MNKLSFPLLPGVGGGRVKKKKERKEKKQHVMTSGMGESHFLALGLAAGEWELWGHILGIAAEFGSPKWT